MTADDRDAQIWEAIRRLQRQRVTFRWATVTAADPEAATFDADVDGAPEPLLGMPVDREQIMPNVGNRVLLTVDGATPRYDRPSRIYPAVIDPVTGETLAAIGDDGQVSGQVGNFDSLVVGGQPFVPTAAEDQESPRGIVEYGGRYADSAGTSAELGVFEIAANLDASRLYAIETSSLVISGPAGAQGRARIRGTTDGSTPTTTSDVFATIAGTAGSALDNGKPLRRLHSPAISGLHRFLLTVARTGGTAGNVGLTGATSFPIQMWVEDIGPFRGNHAVDNDGGGVSVTVQRTLTKTYDAVWSGSYNGSALQTFAGNELRQGPYGGDWRGMLGFNSAQIVSDLAGATIESCVLYLHAKHWYFDSGGTAIIGTHTNSSRPGTWTGVTQDRWRSPTLGSSKPWPKPGGRRLNLGVAVGNEFKAGTTKGIALGPAPSSNRLYYGKFGGVGAANPPYLEIRYSK